MQTNNIGWRWIGIGVSIVWFIGFARFFWDDRDFERDYLPMCQSRLTSDNERLQFFEKGERDKWQARNLSQYEKCRTDAETLYRRQLAIDKKQIPWVLSVDYFTVLMGWWLIWCMIRITDIGKWIKRRLS